jgi:hypothetical protein
VRQALFFWAETQAYMMLLLKCACYKGGDGFFCLSAFFTVLTINDAVFKLSNILFACS